MIEQRKTRKLVLTDRVAIKPNAVVYGIGETEVGLRQDIRIIADPYAANPTYGSKCEHGVYIPSNADNPDRAPYCTLCCPLLLLVREGAVYRA